MGIATGAFAELYAKAATRRAARRRRAPRDDRAGEPERAAEFLAAEERRDPEGFRAEYLAEFVGSGGAFLDAENVAACVDLEGELRPGRRRDWVAGLDPAFCSDPFGLVLVGRDPRDPRRLLVGRVRSWEPPRRRTAVSLEEAREVEDAVLAEVAQVLRHFDARAITDQYRSAGVTERLRRYGCQRARRADDRADEGRRLGVPARAAERGRHRAARAPATSCASCGRSAPATPPGARSVVLPRIGGSHCDLAQALAIAVYEHDLRLPGEAGDQRRLLDTCS